MMIYDDPLMEKRLFLQDCELLAEDLERLVKSYKSVVQLELGEEFPEDPKAQLWGAVGAVFNSWMNQRAKTYRRFGCRNTEKNYKEILHTRALGITWNNCNWLRSCEINSGS